ncbi:MAG TPA: NlpC/P60 family protein [Actinomycetota bacterium]|nr:NlpC/P60 family protein [Actinomycetota bacterium]
MTGTRRRIARLVVAVVFTVPVVLSLSLASLAAPSAEEVRAAKERAAELGREFEAVVEQYNDAKYRLSLTEKNLAEANEQRREAESQAEVAESRLAERAVQAYVGTGSEIDGLLGASSLGEFSDKLEFMGALAENDAALALAAANARQEAEWAAARYRDLLAERRAQVEQMKNQLDRLDRMLDAQAALAERLEQDREAYLDALAQQREALAAAQQETTTAAPAPTGGGGGGFVPPVNASAAQIAVAAAYDVVGTPYVFGSSNPDVGLDCSGVTVYAWGQAGVSLPHSAAAQYSSFPKIPLSAVEPGDLIYYGNFGPHIAIYVGNNTIIHASSPAPGGQTRVDSMYGYDEPWGAVRVA